MTTGTLAFIILIAILAQVAAFVVIGLFRRRRTHRNLGARLSDTQVNSVAEEPPRAARKPAAFAPAWEGFREFSVVRREYEDGNRSICSFYLVPIDASPLPAFRPGQFLTFRLQIEDPVSGDTKNVVRCYSLSDRPRADHYRVSIKRVLAPPDRPELPPGVSSNFFHDHVKVGTRLLVKAPSGHFHLLENEDVPIVLIAGGVGITPMLSILNTVLNSGVNREILLFYGVRNGGEHIMKAHLQSLADAHKNFHLHVCYSSPSENDLQGVDYQHRGRVDIALLRATLKLMRYQFYVCGPKPMMESMVPALAEWGVDEGDIHYESFGPATLIKHEKASKEEMAAQPITVTFSKSGKTVPWAPSIDSLLEFAEANGIDVASGCRAGSCGSCQTPIKAGEVDYNQQPDADVAPGHCLLCISTPKSNLTLDA